MQKLSIIILLLGALSLSGCGVKGDLYFPPDNSNPQQENQA